VDLLNGHGPKGRSGVTDYLKGQHWGRGLPWEGGTKTKRESSKKGGG